MCFTDGVIGIRCNLMHQSFASACLCCQINSACVRRDVDVDSSMHTMQSVRCMAVFAADSGGAFV